MFRDNCREIGQKMKQVAVQVSKHIDRLLVKKIPSYEAGLFYNAMDSSIKAKARMLYYYPTPQQSVEVVKKTDNWIAWHNDRHS